MTIRNKYENVHKYGQNGCGELKISVKLEFECSYFLHALDGLRKILKNETNYEIIYDTDKQNVVVLIFPNDIKLISKLEEDLEELKEICYWD